jgi:hypothetical protein
LFADGGHVFESRGGIFEIAATPEFAGERLANAHGSLRGPGAIGIDAEGHGGAEFLVKELQGFDFEVRFQDTGLELDRTESVTGDHGLDLPDERVGREGFAIFILAPVVSLAAPAGVLVEGIGGERDFVADAAADEFADGLADGFSDEVEAGDFDG